jgi:hypothetical protein
MGNGWSLDLWPLFWNIVFSVITLGSVAVVVSLFAWLLTRDP